MDSAMHAKRNELRSYLLAEPGSDGHEEFEAWLGEIDDRTFEKLLDQVEDEIIDEFVWDELSSEEIACFEKNFLYDDGRRRKLAFALSFARALEERAETWQAPATAAKEETRGRILPFRRLLPAFAARPAFGVAMAATLTLVTLGGVWSFVDGQRLERELAQAVAAKTALLEREAAAQRQLAEQRSRAERFAGELESERDRGVELETEIEALRLTVEKAAAATPRALSAIASIWLSPGRVRGGGEMERIILSAEDGLVRLLLDLGVDDYQSYRATLHDAEGDELWSQSRLAARSIGDRVAVTLELPTSLLPRGDYSVRLSGTTASGGAELAGRYYLRVVRN